MRIEESLGVRSIDTACVTWGFDTGLKHMKKGMAALIVGSCAISAAAHQGSATSQASEIVVGPPHRELPPPAPPLSRASRPMLKSGSISADDYSDAAIFNGESGVSIAQFEVGVDGLPSNCVATGATPELDALMCRLILQRFHYQAATDVFGKPIASKTSLKAQWSLPGFGPGPTQPRREAKVSLVVAQTGAIGSCRAVISSGNTARDANICGWISDHWRFPPNPARVVTRLFTIPVLPTFPLQPDE